jgi:hypothetical protein
MRDPATTERMRRRTGWTGDRLDGWTRELERVGRRSDAFDPDRLVELLREARGAGAPCLVLAEAAGEPSSSVRRWLGGRRPTPASDPRPRPTCAREGCLLPAYGRSDLCERHDRVRGAKEYESRFHVKVSRGLQRGRRRRPTWAQAASRRSALERRTERLRGRIPS